MRYRHGLGVLFPKVFSKVKGYLAKEVPQEGPATNLPPDMVLLAFNIHPKILSDISDANSSLT